MQTSKMKEWKWLGRTNIHNPQPQSDPQATPTSTIHAQRHTHTAVLATPISLRYVNEDGIVSPPLLSDNTVRSVGNASPECYADPANPDRGNLRGELRRGVVSPARTRRQRGVQSQCTMSHSHPYTGKHNASVWFSNDSHVTQRIPCTTRACHALLCRCVAVARASRHIKFVFSHYIIFIWIPQIIII